MKPLQIAVTAAIIGCLLASIVSVAGWLALEFQRSSIMLAKYESHFTLLFTSEGEIRPASIVLVLTERIDNLEERMSEQCFK